MKIKFEIPVLRDLEAAFSQGCWNHCCVVHSGYGQEEY